MTGSVGAVVGRLLVLATVVGLLVAAGCGDGDGEADVGTGSTSSTAARDTSAPLDGRAFVSTSVEGRELVPGSTVTMSFQEGRVSVQAGCNTMTGPYTFDGTTLTVGDMAGTMMGCEPALMDQDQWLAGYLAAGPAASLEGDTLRLTADGVTVTLVDRTVAEPARPLAGTAWSLETLVEGEAASSVPAGVEPPTMQIGEDGFAAVFTGCNRGRSAVGTNGPTLSFGPLALTRMACPGDAAAVEASVVAVLDGDVTFAIEGDQLTLTKGDRQLVYRAA